MRGIGGKYKKIGTKKRNVIIRGVVVKKEWIEGLREVKEIVNAIGAMLRMEGIRKIERREKERGEMVRVKFASVENKLEVMKGKLKFRDRRKWI